MLGRRTRNLLVKLLRVLHAGAERLAARLEASDQLTEAAAGKAEVAQDPAPVQLPNQGVGGPPAHWLDVVRHHAPQLLRPVSGQGDTVTGLRERGEQGATPDPTTALTPGRQPAPPAAGQKTTPPAWHTLPKLRHRARQTSVPPDSGTQANRQKQRSVTPEGALPQIRARRDRHASTDITSVRVSRHAAPRKEPDVCSTPRPRRQPSGESAQLVQRHLLRSRPAAPRKEPDVCSTLRPGRQPSGESAQLVQRHLLRPAGGEVPKPPPRSKVYDSSVGPAEIPAGFSRSKKRQPGSLRAAPGQKRHKHTKSSEQPDGAQAVKQMVAPVREAMQVAAQASPQAERCSRSASRQLLGSAPATLGTPTVVPLPLRSTGEAVARPVQAEPEWPRLPDETDGDLQGTHTGTDRWPSLPEYAWDPGARLSPSDALRTASEERRNTLRLQRGDLEQRGELWNV